MTTSSIENELVSAHLRSLQAGHLIDVVSTDQHTVKPWFVALDVSPPVIDSPQGFTLIGGRLDYVNAREIGAVVQAPAARHQPVRGADREHRTEGSEYLDAAGLQYPQLERPRRTIAVSDIGSDELNEFGEVRDCDARANRKGERRILVPYPSLRGSPAKKQSIHRLRIDGLLRFARNDEGRVRVYADLRTALSTRVLPSDQIAPGTLWLPAITSSNDFSIQLQSSSVIVNGGSSLMVCRPWPATWVRIL